MPDDPRVSVVIPTLDRRDDLLKAIASVETQSVPVHQIIICDDGSSDGTAEAVANLSSPLIELITGPTLGPAGNRNRGIRRATGELVAFCDSDDRWLPDRLARAVAPLRNDADVAATYGHVRVVDGNDTLDERATSRERRLLERTRRAGATPRRLWSGAAIFTSTVTIRRSVLDELGGFDERLRSKEDWDLYIRMARAHRLVGVAGEPLAVRRVHDRNTPEDQLYADHLAVCRKHMEELRDRLLPGELPALIAAESRSLPVIRALDGARRALIDAWRDAPRSLFHRGVFRTLIKAAVGLDRHWGTGPDSP